jgi:hypothetical protein
MESGGLASMYDTDEFLFGFPAPEESMTRLRRSGWSAGRAAFTDSHGRVVWQVDARKGETQIKVEGESQSEVWWRAVEAAAACGMLDD